MLDMDAEIPTQKINPCLPDKKTISVIQPNGLHLCKESLHIENNEMLIFVYLLDNQTGIYFGMRVAICVLISHI